MTGTTKGATPPPPRQTARRLAFCPLCGGEQADKPASGVGKPEDALCAGRCTSGWAVLVALRSSESTSSLVADRRRTESEAHEPHAPVLSELLLTRWRAGDWTIDPDDVLAQLGRAI